MTIAEQLFEALGLESPEVVTQREYEKLCNIAEVNSIEAAHIGAFRGRSGSAWGCFAKGATLMNLRELEALLREIQRDVNVGFYPMFKHERLTKAIAYVHRKNAIQHKRHVFFKLRADEQRELLR